MVFISKKDNARKRRVERKIFRETGRRVGFATSIGGGGGGRTITGGSGPSPSDPLFGKIGAGAGQETHNSKTNYSSTSIRIKTRITVIRR